MAENILLISDIHSRNDALSKLIDNLSSQLDSCHLVFLGDLNDCRDKSYQKECSFTEVYKLVRQLCDEGYATLIHSNHAQNLCDHYLQRRKVRKNIVGFKRTLEELDCLGDIERSEMISWLDFRPLGVDFTLDNGKTYYASHAFYDLRLDYSQQNKLTKEEIDRTLRGNKATWMWQGKQYSKHVGFWRNPKRWGAIGSNVLCSGHWEQVIITDNCVVNDPGGHQTNGTIGVFDCINHSITIYNN